MRNRNKRYIENLEKIVRGINNSYHTAIQTSPNSVDKNNELEVWARLYLGKKAIDKTKFSPFKYQIGDFVKTPLKRGKLHRGDYWVNWDEEPKKVNTRFRNYGVNLYQLTDFLGRKLPSNFLEHQLQPILYDLKDKNSMIRTKIIQKDSKGGQPRVKVQFEDWPAKYSKWVSASSIPDRILPGDG